jgi:hypothetical protein
MGVALHHRGAGLDPRVSECGHLIWPHFGRLSSDDTHVGADVAMTPVALCASCNAARSTLGKGQTPVPLPAGVVFDVLGWVATAHQQVGAAEATLAAAVTRARQAGTSWTVIGAQLGISRQGAQQRFTRAPARKSPSRATRTD